MIKKYLPIQDERGGTIKKILPPNRIIECTKRKLACTYHKYDKEQKVFVHETGSSFHFQIAVNDAEFKTLEIFLICHFGFTKIKDSPKYTLKSLHRTNIKPKPSSPRGQLINAKS